MAAFTQASTLKDGDPPSWAVYLYSHFREKDTVMASGFSLVSLRIPFCRVMYCCMRGSAGFGGDWVWQPRHTASKEGTCATLESKLNAKRCKECEAVCVLKDLDAIIPLVCFSIFFWGRKQAKKRRRGLTRWCHAQICISTKESHELLREMLCHSPSPLHVFQKNSVLDTSPYSPSMFLRPRTNLTRTKKAGSLQLPVSKSNDSKLQLPFPSREQEK